MFIKYLLVGYTSRIAASRLAMGGETAKGEGEKPSAAEHVKIYSR